jgi:hypothetical protein
MLQGNSNKSYCIETWEPLGLIRASHLVALNPTPIYCEMQYFYIINIRHISQMVNLYLSKAFTSV